MNNYKVLVRRILTFLEEMTIQADSQEAAMEEAYTIAEEQDPDFNTCISGFTKILETKCLDNE